MISVLIGPMLTTYLPLGLLTRIGIRPFIILLRTLGRRKTLLKKREIIGGSVRTRMYQVKGLGILSYTLGLVL